MKLTFKRREIKDLHQLGTLVSENVEAIEPGLRIIGSNLNLGRAGIELVALDGADTPVLITLGLTADDTMLLRALEAYAWCLDYPESLQNLVPGPTQPEWPPRVVFVAERLLESFRSEERRVGKERGAGRRRSAAEREVVRSTRRGGGSTRP